MQEFALYALLGQPGPGEHSLGQLFCLMPLSFLGRNRRLILS